MRKIAINEKLIKALKWRIANQIKTCFIIYPKKINAVKEAGKYWLKMNKLYRGRH